MIIEFLIIDTDLKSFLISEVKYNIPFVEQIIQYDESSTISTFWLWLFVLNKQFNLQISTSVNWSVS